MRQWSNATNRHGGVKAFELSFGLTIDEFYIEFERFMNLTEEAQMTILDSFFITDS